MTTAERVLVNNGVLGHYVQPEFPWLDKNIMQVQVEMFMREKDQVLGDTPAFRDVILRMHLMREEWEETENAIKTNDLPQAIDGLCDLLYTVFGTLSAWGVNAQAVFNLVHETNMAKSKAKKDNLGKVLKPDGWKPPAIREYLIEQGWKENEG